MKFNQAPLPFVGQKRNFLKNFCHVLNDNIPDTGKGWTIIDVFGGSGLLAHHAKMTKPDARVIYNDFDHYMERLNNIEDINRLRRILLTTIGDIPFRKRLDNKTKDLVLNEIKNFKGYIDIASLQTWLLFSGRQINSLDQLFNKSLWNRIRKTDYPNATGYLNNVEIISKSFDLLLPDFVNHNKTLLILDPPYLFTDQTNYLRNSSYFGQVEFRKLMALISPPFIYFSSDKTRIKDCFNFLIEQNDERFINYECINIKAPISHNMTYQDNMIFKF